MNNDVTIFEQDGVVYCVISHDMPVKTLAKEIAKEIRCLDTVPRARMRVVSVEEFKAMPLAMPKKV